MDDIRQRFADIKASEVTEKSFEFFREICTRLERGSLRTAEFADGEWKVNTWVKEAILWGFRIGKLTEYENTSQKYFDKSTLPLQDISLQNKIRVVPGGSSIRTGAYVSPGTIIMPPSYINIGAYIDEGCLIDSHALVGSCAQVGKNVHLSAASQLGGVLEPIGAMPVIIEDNVFIGGNCGIYEGTIVRKNAVIGTGVILNKATPLFDNTTGEFLSKSDTGNIIVPENAVVIAGSRPITKWSVQGIHIYCPVIIKYRDEKTGNSITLEDVLR